MADMDDIERAAASKSLYLTINEIMDFLGDNTKRPGGQGADLRAFLHKKIADFGTHWYKHGVRRGYMETYEQWKETGEVSEEFKFEAEREIFPGQTRSIHVTKKM